jgi:serine protease Do
MCRFRAVFYCLTAAALMSGGVSVLALDSPALTLARQLNEAFIQVADDVSPTVVIIEVTQKAVDNDDQSGGSWWDLLPPEDRPHRRFHRHGSSSRPIQGEGSGIVITEDGYILTNNHVVENATKILVRFKDGRTFDGEVKGTDPASDVAVIKINAKGLKPAKLGDSDITRVGEFVLAIGAPFTLSYSVTFGHVSAKGRSFENETPGYSDQDFIQTDASINPGNSGGPLVNLYGEVIAINTMIEGMNTGIGFAIPINLAKRVKDHLIAEGKFARAWIGVGIVGLKDDPQYRELGQELAPDTESGVVVRNVLTDGPAWKSGVREGDVIVSVEDKKVETARELQDVISTQTPGHVLTLKVVRAKEHLAIKVQTELVPEELALAQTKPAPDAGGTEMPTFGMSLQPLTKDLADRYGVESGSGVIVTKVEHDSPADAEGIKEGDVITEINRHRVSNVKQFRQLVRESDAKKGVLVDLISEGSARMLILKEDGQ